MQNHCRYEFSPWKSNKDENGVFLQAHECQYLSVLVALSIQFSMLTRSRIWRFSPSFLKQFSSLGVTRANCLAKPHSNQFWFFSFLCWAWQFRATLEHPAPHRTTLYGPLHLCIQLDVPEQHQDYARGSDLPPTHKSSLLEQPVDHFLLIQQVIGFRQTRPSQRVFPRKAPTSLTTGADGV